MGERWVVLRHRLSRGVGPASSHGRTLNAHHPARRCSARPPILADDPAASWAEGLNASWAARPKRQSLTLNDQRSLLIASTLNAQCPMPNAQRPTPNAQRPTPNAQCPMPNAKRPIFVNVESVTWCVEAHPACFALIGLAGSIHGCHPQHYLFFLFLLALNHRA